MYKFMALLANGLQVFQILAILSGICQMMHVVHWINLAPLTDPIRTPLNSLLLDCPFTACQVAVVSFFAVFQFHPVAHFAPLECHID
jgi:hypothetical protein